MSESNKGSAGRGPTDELGRDMEVAAWLEAMDPASVEPNYWLRFQSRVLIDAAPELARRRLMTDLTVGEVMSSWARAVIPTAVLAAAFAGILVVRGPAQIAPAPVGVEELLLAEVEGATIPATLDDDESSMVVFASESF